VPDELLRPFREKLRGRASSARSAGEPADAPVEEVRPDTIMIRDVVVGPFPEAARLHAGFTPGVPRVRLTLDVGLGLRKKPGPLGVEETKALLGFCPRLLDHDCGAGGVLRGLLSGVDQAAGHRAGTAATDEAAPEARDGLNLAHLIEHVAIELIVGVTRAPRCSGATCAHAGRLDRFDIFLECTDPLAGRAAAILAAALVRDLRIGHTDRLILHRRCLELLTLLAPAEDSRMVAEDVALRLACGRDEAMQTLQEMVRLGYMEAGPAAYLFSSPTGVLFRRAALQPSAR
jgi:hypothetical protein